MVVEMVLHVGGVVHEDPLGRSSLQAWFRQIERRNGSHPSFVGVEYAAQIFPLVVAARAKLQGMLSHTFPRYVPCLIRAMADALGYEGDSHEEIWPDVETVWLDPSRPTGDIAGGRLPTYRNAARYLPSPNPTIADWSRLVWRYQPPPEQKWERDQRWAQLLRGRFQRAAGSAWAVLVVGAAHADDYPNNLVDLLRKEKVYCEVAFMTPDGPLPTHPSFEIPPWNSPFGL